MSRGNWSEEQKVHRLITDRDLAGRSRTPEEFPVYHDPIIQLIGVVAALVSSLIWSMTTEGVPHRVSQALVIGSCLLGAAVLLRSVRNGWNVSVYRRARRALQQEANLRSERNALRDVSVRCASLRRHGSKDEALEALQALTAQTQQVLERSAGGQVALAVVEEVGGRYLVLCAAGFIGGKPFHVAPGKSCRVDRPFSALLGSFAPEGRSIFEERRCRERKFWIGLAAKGSQGEIDPGALDALGAWVGLLDDMDLIPRKVVLLDGVA
jgi:hypothetical protein